MRRLAAALGVLIVTAACSASSDRVILAAGTTLVDSGFLEAVVAEFEATHPGIDVAIVGDATARVLELGARGAADVLITHDPEAEADFLREHVSAVQAPAFRSRFLLVGPASRVGELDGLTAATAFTRIAQEAWVFVSRGDGSGTHAKELEIWREAGIDPTGRPWYLETGQGMGLTLQVADQRNAFTLTEEGAYLAAQDALALVPVDLTETLVNPYTVTVPRPDDEGARSLYRWLTAPEGQAAVAAAAADLFGAAVYEPVTER